MKKFIMMGLLFCCCTVFAQKAKHASDSSIKTGSTASFDSFNTALQENLQIQNALIDSMNRARQKKDLDRMAENSINYFAQLSREREAAQKKKMWMYLGFGSFGLIVMIVGLMRKKKAGVKN